MDPCTTKKYYENVLRERSNIAQDNMGPLETPPPPMWEKRFLLDPPPPGAMNARNLMTPFSMINAVNFEVFTTQSE